MLTGVRHLFSRFNKWHVVIETPDGWYYVEDEGKGKENKLSDSELKDIKHMLEEYDRNRLSFFLPHGPKEDGGLDFINDYEHDICMLTAPTRTGKSCHGVGFTLFRSLKCDENWHCFQNHGIKFPEYMGKRKVVVSSYEWTNVQELWEEYMRWIPRKVVGKFLPDWGKYPDETGRQRIIDLKSGKVTKVVLGDGTEIIFRCDRQAQGPWESQRWDAGHFDEQRQREKFIGYLRGTSNTFGRSQCCFTLTGHVLDDRPDTGASGWIKNELYDGNYTFGKTVGRFNLDIETTPDPVMSIKTKSELHQQWVIEPEKNKDEATLRKATARYWGKFEHGSGLVIDNFYPEHHIIPEVVSDHLVFVDATRYRGLDHGLGRPATCAWIMMFPWGDMLMYKEYYEPGRSIPYHVKKITEMSGSERIRRDDYVDDKIEEVFGRYEEAFDKYEYNCTVLDGRSFASPAQESDRTIGELWNDWGLRCTPAKGYRNEKIVPDMRIWFDLDKDRNHLMHELWTRGAIADALYQKWLVDRGGSFKNAPRIYFTCDLRHVFSEIRKWAVDPHSGLPRSEHDHIIGGALKYIIAERPKYWGNRWKETPQEYVKSKNSYCNY